MSDRSNMDMIREWESATSSGLPARPTPLSPGLRALRSALLREEFQEVIAEVMEGESLEALAKELADLLYLTYGIAAQAGIDLDRAFADVHRSNLSKLGTDGQLELRLDGKVLKGPNYVPPDLTWLRDPAAEGAE